MGNGVLIDCIEIAAVRERFTGDLDTRLASYTDSQHRVSCKVLSLAFQ